MIAIIDYNAGNISCVQNSLTKLGYKSIVTNKAADILAAKKVILPGVGAANSAMESLKKTGLNKIIPKLKQPVLGICLGQQLMCNYSEEGNTECLGIFNENVQLFPNDKIVPHMGWNNFHNITSNFCNGISKNDNVYYIHSYYIGVGKYTIASCKYIKEFSSILNKDNFYATQFHPEKSGRVGEIILRNFLSL